MHSKDSGLQGTFLLAASQYRLDMKGAGEVVHAATLLVDQVASDALVSLAAADSSDTRRDDLVSLIDEVLIDLGRSSLSDEQAGLVIARSTTADITERRVTAYAGAHRLWTLARTVPGLEDTLAPFIGLASEWEDNPDQRADIEADIAAEAAKFAR